MHACIVKTYFACHEHAAPVFMLMTVFVKEFKYLYAYVTRSKLRYITSMLGAALNRLLALDALMSYPVSVAN